MKTKVGNYYIIFDYDDFIKIITKYINNGYTCIDGSMTIPKIDEYPVALNCDKKSKSMLYGIISYHKDIYFNDKKFIKLYKRELRKKKYKRLKKHE